jgi:hypothetical protein
LYYSCTIRTSFFSVFANGYSHRPEKSGKKTAEIIRTAVGDRLQLDVMQEFRIFAVTEQPFLERLLGKIFIVILRDMAKVPGLLR